jgi:hypothetical protein
MIDNQERHLRQAARENRERLAVAHRDVVMEEQAKNAFDIRQNMARLKGAKISQRSTTNPDRNLQSQPVCKTEAEKTVQINGRGP